MTQVVADTRDIGNVPAISRFSIDSSVSVDTESTVFSIADSLPVGTHSNSDTTLTDASAFVTAPLRYGKTHLHDFDRDSILAEGGSVIALEDGVLRNMEVQRSKPIPPPDRGHRAWLFLVGAFWIEALIYGGLGTG